MSLYLAKRKRHEVSYLMRATAVQAYVAIRDKGAGAREKTNLVTPRNSYIVVVDRGHRGQRAGGPLPFWVLAQLLVSCVVTVLDCTSYYVVHVFMLHAHVTCTCT